jgi:hypothetical protein
VSDFIIEHCGHLVLWEFKQESQEKLLRALLCPGPVVPSMTPAAAPSTMPIIPTTKKAAPKKKAATKKTAAKNVPATCCTLEHADAWVPPPLPAPFTSYQIPSFDARCIIYLGANYDPWWDMPQLISQANNFASFVLKIADIYSID